MTLAEFAKRATIVIGLALVPLLAWYLFDVLVIITGAILTAALLEILAEPFYRLRFPRSVALVAAGLIICAAVAGAGYLFGTQTASEMQEVFSRLNQAQQGIVAALQKSALGSRLLSGVKIPIIDILGPFLSVSAGFVLAAAVTVVAGIYLAVQPTLYREGVSKLFPARWRSKIDETLDVLATALRLWLLGQLIDMLTIGVLFGVAAWIIGLPPALALGVIAGVAEFVPYLGPVVAIIPAALVALTLAPATLLWTIIAFEFIHFLEGNVIMPLIQRRMVLIPPAVMLLSILLLGALFGLSGVIFAAPITVILSVLITKLYVRDSLGELATLPGEQAVDRAGAPPL